MIATSARSFARSSELGAQLLEAQKADLVFVELRDEATSPRVTEGDTVDVIHDVEAQGRLAKRRHSFGLFEPAALVGEIGEAKRA
jgi:hypothetical protein